MLAGSLVLLAAACGGLSRDDQLSSSSSALSTASAPAPVRSCASLAALTRLPHNTAVTSATAVPAGSFTPPDTAAAVDVPAISIALGVSEATSESQANVDVCQPADGNRKLNGAVTADTAAWPRLPASWSRPPARLPTAGTDRPTAPPSRRREAGLWAARKIADWATGDARHRRRRRAIGAYYRTGPRLSYFTGCSTWARGPDGAQRFPDIQGIVAGRRRALTHQSAAWIWRGSRFHRKP
jgi:feruloyl esterase